MIYILDAYNVIHKIRRLESCLNKDLKAARDALQCLCQEWAASRGDVSEIILVFDGRSEFRDLYPGNSGKIRILFSETGEEADEKIVEVLEDLGSVQKKVVSDDNFVRNQARAYQAPVLSVGQFEALLFPGSKKGSAPAGSTPEISDSEARQITEAYQKALGLGTKPH
jgi:predicted RNA-binding protein with PIN domain